MHVTCIPDSKGELAPDLVCSVSERLVQPISLVSIVDPSFFLCCDAQGLHSFSVRKFMRYTGSCLGWRRPLNNDRNTTSVVWNVDTFSICSHTSPFWTLTSALSFGFRWLVCTSAERTTQLMQPLTLLCPPPTQPVGYSRHRWLQCKMRYMCWRSNSMR